MLISGHERQRYDCQLVLRELGERGQQKLREAGVLVVGAGGLGAPVLSYLAAAGVGRLTIVDDDVVELSNLQRQVLYTTEDVGRPKATCAAARLGALNPEVDITAVTDRFSAANARQLVAAHDAVVTAVDNFTARYLLNDAAVLEHKVLADGSVLRLIGFAMTVKGGETACYRCLFPSPPPPSGVVSCSQQGILGPIPGIIGAIQALEVIKAITGVGQPLFGRLLQFDGQDLSFHEVDVVRDPGCPVCGEHPTITEVREEPEG